MHLHQLKIKNLASLRGEHEIDFDTLNNQDLFAITGETGAGKSTLLNALSLAIYGRLYRRQLIQSDLVTLGERDATISLRFSVKGVSYLSTWSTVVRKKDGSLLGNPRTERFFYQLPPDGNVQEARVLETNPENVLQLDFEQFCKCVVLNQGEFARFLTASFSERRDILERLYPSDNIDSIGGLAKKKFDERKNLSNNLEIQAHALQEESIFDVEAVKTEESRHKKLLGDLEENLSNLRPTSLVLANLLTQSQLHVSARKILGDTEALLKEKTKDCNSAMTTWQTHHEILKSLVKKWDEERPLVETHAQEAQEMLRWIDEQKNLIQQVTEKERQLKSWNERKVIIAKRMKDLEKNQQDLSKKIHLIPVEKDWSQVDIKTGLNYLKSETLLTQHESSFSQRLTQIEAEGKAAKNSVDKIVSEAEKLFSTLPPAWKTLSTQERSKEIDSLKSKQMEKQLHQNTKLKAENQLKDLHPRLQELRLRLSETSWMSALIEMRQQLILKHPQGPEDCPVCEQTLTPGLWKKLTTEWDASRANSHHQDLEKLEAESQTLNSKEAGLKQQIQESTEALAKLDLPSIDTQSFEDIHVRLIQLEVSQKATQKVIDETRLQWKTENEKLQKTLKDKAQLTQDIQSWLQAVSAQLQINLDWSESTLNELQHDFDLHRQFLETERELKTIQAQNLQLAQDMNEMGPVISQLKVKQTSLGEQITKRQSLLASIYGDSSPQERLRERTEEVKAFTQKDQWLQNEYAQKERELGEVRGRLSATQDQLKNVELQFTQEQVKLSPLLKKEVHLKVEEANVILLPMSKEVEEQISKLEAEQKILRDKLTELKTLIEKDRLLSEKRALIKEQKAKLEIEVSRYKRLMEVLGQDDLRTYVLSLVETALIQQTNFELQKLCGGRYEIQHSVRKGKLAPEFWVIDLWRDGLLRKVTTLSGGETFMVSLAMALALAEMTRGKADIDCFFIDEGFGTLDEDSLDGVLEMLQQVRSRGKQIGLITHVKSLSSRLPLNLHLQKDQRGNSTVNVVWN